MSQELLPVLRGVGAMEEKQVTDAPAAEPDPAAPIHHLASGHEKHCFVVMPSGREPSEQKWFRGWYEVVIKPAVAEAGYEPILAAAEEQPGAINDDIRAHLALDSMVVVDLAGAEPEDDPNPNVMYELGIRHALGLPLVMMAWRGQRLPFDVSNQRVIMEDRDLVDLDLNRKKLISFIHAAQQGKFYRPMDAVSRIATIHAASESLGEDSLLRALAQEVRDLRVSLASANRRPELKRPTPVPKVKQFVRKKLFRKELYAHLVNAGGDPSMWSHILSTPVSPEAVDEFRTWTIEQWKAFVSQRLNEIILARSGPDSALERNSEIDLKLLAQVRSMLPSQPWPPGVHKEIAEKLGMGRNSVSKYIQELIRVGDFMEQQDGQLIPPGDDN
jgi:hypothetical protein